MFMLYATGQRLSSCPVIKLTIQHCSEYWNQCLYPFPHEIEERATQKSLIMLKWNESCSLDWFLNLRWVFFPHDQVIFLNINSSIFHTPPLKTAQCKQHSHTDLFNKCNVGSVEEVWLRLSQRLWKYCPVILQVQIWPKYLCSPDPLINKLMSYYYSAAVGGKAVIPAFRSRLWLRCWLQASIHYFMHHILGGKNDSSRPKIDVLHKDRGQFVHMFTRFSHRNKPWDNEPADDTRLSAIYWFMRFWMNCHQLTALLADRYLQQQQQRRENPLFPPSRSISSFSSPRSSAGVDVSRTILAEHKI